jgi:hypothetical protein
MHRPKRALVEGGSMTVPAAQVIGARTVYSRHGSSQKKAGQMSTILHPSDNSPASQSAFSHAIKIALAKQSSLAL